MLTSKDRSILLLVVSQLLFFASIFCIDPFPVHAQQESKLKKAQWLFQHENCEEALVLFNELRAEQPQSSEVAYYLGLTYKRLITYKGRRLRYKEITQRPAKIKQPHKARQIYIPPKDYPWRNYRLPGLPAVRSEEEALVVAL